MNILYQVANLGFVVLLVAFNTCGDLLLARTMRRVGDVDMVHRRTGLFGVVSGILGRVSFYGAVLCMAAGFFSLLIALSRIDLSVVIPAVSSLAFLSSLMGAKYLLKEHLDLRRWIAGAIVALGIALLTIK